MAISPASSSPSTSGKSPSAVRVFCAFLAACFALPSTLPSLSNPSTWSSQSATRYDADAAFLDELQARALLFFNEHSDPFTGLTKDRAPTDGSPSDSPASIAASGFALTAWCIGEARGWMTRDEVIQRTLTLLHFVHDKVEHERGWFYHFIDARTGKRAWRCEASTIDTALFLKGALVAREYLQVPEISDLVDRIYSRIDWTWAMNGGTTLTHGWRPETGFLKSRWDSYSELLGLYLLGIGAPKNALPAASWRAWQRGPVVTFNDRTFINCPPLFTHQYPHAWFDFRGKTDGLTDYWQNSVNATLAQREWCAELASDFPRWSLNVWGVTASDSAKGYVDWGGPIANNHRLDGTVVPCAPGGSLPFAPRECMDALRAMREVGGEAVWGRYGFADAFNPHTGWISPDVIAIDVGITMLMAENMRTGFVWKYFMQSPEAKRGMHLAGFRDRREIDDVRNQWVSSGN
jgi:hypothetical protein